MSTDRAGSRPTAARRRAGTGTTVGRLLARLPGGGSSRVAAGILASRVAGLAREVAIAAFLGNGAALEALSVALRIPNVLQNLLGEGVLSASFIPSYTRLLAEGRTREAGRLASTILSLLLLVTGLLVVLGVVLAGPLTSLIAGGLSGERRELTVSLVRIITPGIGLLVASAWCLGVLNSHRRFFLSYVAPVAWNVAQIVAVAVAGTLVFSAATTTGDTATINVDARNLALTLGWATVVGAALQVAVQVPSVRGLQPDLRLGVRIDGHVRTVIARFLPVVGARGVVQLSAFFDTFLASFLAVGAIGSLRYSQVLYLLPVSLFGMSVAAAELPNMSAATSQDREEAVRSIQRTLRAGLRRIAWFVVPTAVAYVVAGDMVVGALLQRGEFTRTDTIQTWLVLGGYAVGLLGATSARLLQSAAYGLGDTRGPARASLVRVAVSTALGVVLMVQLDQVGVGPDGLQVVGDLPALAPLPAAVREAPGVPRLGVLGLTLASGVAAWVEYVLLRDRLRRVIGPVPLAGGVLDQTLLGAGAAVVVTVLGRLVLGGLPVLLQALLVLPAAAAAYLATTRALGFPFARAASGRPPSPSAAARRSTTRRR